MKLAILVPVMKCRSAFAAAVLSQLQGQLKFCKREAALLELNVNERTANVAGVRNTLLAMARLAGAKYFSFVDDDDLVDRTYVESILGAIDANPGVDTVQFQQAFYADGVFNFVEKHSLRYHGVFTDAGQHYRDISHLSATRLDLALPFRIGDDTLERRSEDSRWADDMRIAAKLKTEAVIDHVLYHYFWRSHKEELVA